MQVLESSLMEMGQTKEGDYVAVKCTAALNEESEIVGGAKASHIACDNFEISNTVEV